MDILYIYNNNQKFKKYVDAYAFAMNETVEVALTHKMVQMVSENYKEKLVG